MLSMDKIEAPVLRDLVLGGGTILVIGAYKGDTVAFLREWHPDSTIFAYEPQIWAYWKLRDRFKEDEAVKLFNFGLGVEYNSAQPLYEFGTDAASVLPLEGWRTRENVTIHNARIICGAQESVGFDGWPALTFMNIEGAEYALIPYLLEHKFRTRCWLIQFHHKETMRAEYALAFVALEASGYTREIIGSGWEFWQ